MGLFNFYFLLKLLFQYISTVTLDIVVFGLISVVCCLSLLVHLYYLFPCQLNTQIQLLLFYSLNIYIHFIMSNLYLYRFNSYYSYSLNICRSIINVLLLKYRNTYPTVLLFKFKVKLFLLSYFLCRKIQLLPLLFKYMDSTPAVLLFNYICSTPPTVFFIKYLDPSPTVLFSNTQIQFLLFNSFTY